MRDNPIMGPAKGTSGLTIPNKADSTTNPGISLFEGYAVCPYGKLPSIWKGDPEQSRQ